MRRETTEVLILNLNAVGVIRDETGVTKYFVIFTQFHWYWLRFDKFIPWLVMKWTQESRDTVPPYRDTVAWYRGAVPAALAGSYINPQDSIKEDLTWLIYQDLLVIYTRLSSQRNINTFYGWVTGTVSREMLAFWFIFIESTMNLHWLDAVRDSADSSWALLGLALSQAELCSA